MCFQSHLPSLKPSKKHTTQAEVAGSSLSSTIWEGAPLKPLDPQYLPKKSPTVNHSISQIGCLVPHKAFKIHYLLVAA